MESRPQIGKNRTGIQMSPVDIRRMLQASEQDASAQDDGDLIDGSSSSTAMRSSYIAEADPLGTVPPPGTVKGAAKTGIKKLTGRHPEVFIDKLGERLAFERSGTRLYDALITKCEANGIETDVSLDALRDIREDELNHFQLLAECMNELGADPTAQTPAADVTAVESMGLIQVINDPRTTLEQCLHAIHVAELADNAGWELLISLAEDAGQEKMVERFRDAYADEQMHLDQVEAWHEQLVRQQAS